MEGVMFKRKGEGMFKNFFFKGHIYSFREVLYKFCKETVTCAG